MIGRGVRPARPRMTGPVIPTQDRSKHPGYRSPFEFFISGLGRDGSPSRPFADRGACLGGDSLCSTANGGLGEPRPTSCIASLPMSASSPVFLGRGATAWRPWADRCRNSVNCPGSSIRPLRTDATQSRPYLGPLTANRCPLAALPRRVGLSSLAQPRLTKGGQPYLRQTASQRVPVSPCPRVPLWSRDDIAYHMPMDVGETVVAALETISETLVVEA